MSRVFECLIVIYTKTVSSSIAKITPQFSPSLVWHCASHFTNFRIFKAIKYDQGQCAHVKLKISCFITCVMCSTARFTMQLECMWNWENYSAVAVYCWLQNGKTTQWVTRNQTEKTCLQVFVKETEQNVKFFFQIRALTLQGRYETMWRSVLFIKTIQFKKVFTRTVFALFDTSKIC